MRLRTIRESLAINESSSSYQYTGGSQADILNHIKKRGKAYDAVEEYPKVLTEPIELNSGKHKFEVPVSKNGVPAATLLGYIEYTEANSDSVREKWGDKFHWSEYAYYGLSKPKTAGSPTIENSSDYAGDLYHDDKFKQKPWTDFKEFDPKTNVAADIKSVEVLGYMPDADQDGIDLDIYCKVTPTKGEPYKCIFNTRINGQPEDIEDKISDKLVKTIDQLAKRK